MTTTPGAVPNQFIRAGSIKPPAPPSHDFDVDTDAGLTHPVLATSATVVRLDLDDYPKVPEPLTVAHRLRTVLEQTREELWAEVPSAAELPAMILDGIASGDTPADVVDHVVDLHHKRDRAAVANSYLIRAIEQSEGHFRRAVEAALPDLMDGLREQLESVVATLRAAYVAVGGLDIHQPDPMLVAQASPEQQAALVTIAEETKTYRTIRRLQRDALVVSTLPIPGNHSLRVSWSWRDVFDTGVHEISAPGRAGLPGAGSPARPAVHAVVSRPDVWLPSPEQLAEAYDRMVSLIEGEDREAADAAAAERAATAATPVPPGYSSGTVAYLDAVTNNSGVRR